MVKRMKERSIYDRIMSRAQPEELATNTTSEPPRKKPNRFGAVLLSLLGIAVAGGAGYLGARLGSTGSSISAPALADTIQDKANPTDTPFQQHAKQAQLRTCSTVFPALGALLTNGAQYSVQSIWNAETPDKHAIQAFAGMNYQSDDYRGPAAGIVYAAPVAGACEGAMIRVAPVNSKCVDVPAILPPGSKLANTLGEVTVYSLGKDNGDALLLPSGDSCIVISVASAAEQVGAEKGARR
jgi:hypothetical protein